MKNQGFQQRHVTAPQFVGIDFQQGEVIYDAEVVSRDVGDAGKLPRRYRYRHNCLMATQSYI